MAELVYHIATSVDLFIADKNGVADDSVFLYADDGGDFLESVRNYDIVLMGRKTYEYGFQYGLNPGDPSGIAQAANPGMKHYIFSNELNFDSNEKVELIREDVERFCRKLKNDTKNQQKKIWLCGGGELAGKLLDHKLIDTLVLKVNPIILGEGIALFGTSNTRIDLKLLDIKTYESGIYVPTYQIDYKD